MSEIRIGLLMVEISLYECTQSDDVCVLDSRRDERVTRYFGLNYHCGQTALEICLIDPI